MRIVVARCISSHPSELSLVVAGIIEKSAIEGQKTYHGELMRAMRSYIHEHQTEFIPAGLDPATVADVVQEPSLPSATQALAGGEGDDEVRRAREQEGDQRGLQWAYDTLEGTLSVARQSFAGAIELLRDAWDSYFSQLASSSNSNSNSTSSSSSARTSPPSTSTILYAAIAVLVLSNLWTLTLVGKAPEQRKDPQARQSEEREKWVHGIVTALWHELEAGRQPGVVPSPTAASADSSSSSQQQQQPIVPPPAVQLPDYWHEEVAQLRRALDTVEERVRAVRQSLAELD